MKIKYSDNAVLFVNLTDKMIRDYRDCQKSASSPGPGKDCDICSMNVDINGMALCEMPVIVEAIERVYIPDDHN